MIVKNFNDNVYHWRSGRRGEEREMTPDILPPPPTLLPAVEINKYPQDILNS